MQWLHFGIRYSSFRYKGFYKKIAAVPNVRLIPVNIDSYSLINGAQLVSAVTGSAGWEAALRSKPSIIFGTVWYQDCPGIFKAANVGDCRASLEKILNGYQVDQQKIINYLKAFGKSTIRAYIAPTSREASKLSKEESMKNITLAVLNELERV